MPASLTSSFASAAAGGNSENGTNRRDGPAGNEWSRNRPNGATQTFRRTSQATTQSRENLQSVPSSSFTGPYVPPHLNQPGLGRNGATVDARYSRDQLLSIYRGMKDNGTLNRTLDQAFQGPWDHTVRNGGLQAKESKEQSGPELCWISQNDSDPLGMIDMSDAERQLFTTSVNSPIKLTQNKDGGANVGGARKTSISNHHNSAYATISGPGSRPTVRRRETSESFTGNGPLSPVENKQFFRNEPNTNTPPALLRRRTDYQEEEARADGREIDNQLETEAETQTPLSSLRRLTTATSNNGPIGPGSSPWSAAPGGPRSAFESMGGFGNFAVAGTTAGQEVEKRPGFGSARGGSRFKDLLAKASVEDMSPSVKEKSSFGVLGKLPEEDPDSAPSRLKDVFKTRPNRSETNPYDEAVPRSGSAALSQDEHGIEQMGFSSFGPNAGQGELQGTPHGRRNIDPLSPTSTNPYQSPAGGKIDDEDGSEHAGQLPGHQSFGNRRDVFSGTHDRNQPSGFGPPRPALGGLGGMSGWGSSAFGSGTPGRERPTVSSAFGDSIFSPMADLQSPSGPGIGGAFFSSGVIGSAGRPSRLGALFPPAMQEQMRADSRNDAFEAPGESRDPFSGARREEGFRNMFEEGRSTEGNFSPQPGAGPQSSVGAPGTAQRNSAGPEQSSGHGQSQSSGSAGSNALPAAQQRQMVMPDRMRWIYRDPQGNVQGPWSGLEMHDWFKAGFFTAELQVKKLEDVEYEPLAQLVRRIGNSREPFLVPQIGVPHGPPNVNQGNHWASTMSTTAGTQPPFANSFPSFGTTLTAEQQNALERRKQEEQYLMARQKEHLAQQQMYMKQMQMQNPSSGVHNLQHHSSAHSLHSQPSFGSIASPNAYQPSPMQGPIQPPRQLPGFGSAPGAGPPHGHDDELAGMVDRMNFNQRSGLPFGASPGSQPPIMGQGQGTYQERARLGPDGRQAETRAHEEAFLGQDGRNERLEEFQDLRDQFDLEHEQLIQTTQPQPIGAQRPSEEPISSKTSAAVGRHENLSSSIDNSDDEENLSLAEQVQRTAAAHEKAAVDDQPVLPPPKSISPLPAPAAQRNRQHVADALAAGSRSPTQTPIAETPTSSSVAPWADKTVDLPRGPSLREIQEAEAKRAAEQEELLAAARRAQAEQERVAVAAIPPLAPGLPSSSTWGSSVSPASPGPASSVWSKAGPKPPSTSGATPKKTLAQIQKEEEARKQRAAVQAAQAQAAAVNTQAAITGKRYAELASKVVPATTPTQGGAWTTVGSGGGKAKTPATVVATPATPRAVSTTVTTPLVKRPTLPTTRTASISSQSRANEEFTRWVKAQLGNGLNSGINVDNFVQNLLMLPPEIEIIRDSVYASSQTIHGGRFAEEFVRRRKLADKGIVEPASESGSPGPANDLKSGAGGWSEVAKKGPVKEEGSSTAAFKVVAKKKGRK